MVELIMDVDDVGNCFVFSVNGIEVFMCGVNWIFVDVLLICVIFEVVCDLL